MKGKRYTEEQIAFALRQAKSGVPAVDVCRKMGVREKAFYSECVRTTRTKLEGCLTEIR